MTRASVVIPVYERADLLAPCLDALERAGLDGVELILVDNASADPAMGPLLRSWEANARVLRNPVNLGFATACNQGLQATRAPAVVFLNSDTEVLAGWLEPLLDAIEDPGVGMAGSRLLYPGGRVQHAGMAMTAGGVPVHIHRGVPGEHPAVTRSRDLAMVTAACCAVRRSTALDMGGFDAAYVNGFEDVDLCLRLVRSGLRIRYRGDSAVVHHESMSPGRTNAESANGMLFRRRWRGWPADWAQRLAEDGVEDAGWADCRWRGPLFGHGPDAAMGRAAVRALAEEGRRPCALESAHGPLAPDAADLCDDSLLAALNRLFVRVPAAETYSHVGLARPFSAFFQGGSAIAVLGPGPVDATGVGAAAAVLAAGPSALEAARAEGVPAARLAAIDPGAPAPSSAAAAVLGARRPRQGLGWWGPLVGRSGYAAAGRGLIEAATLADVPIRALPADAAPDGMAPYPLALPAQDFSPATWIVHHPPILPTGQDVWEEVAVALATPVVGAACFEAEGLPRGWAEASRGVREVWVPTAFNARTFAASGVDPERIRVVPYPVDGAMLAAAPRERDPRAVVTFVSVFEWTWRKGWDVLLRAWAEEFAAHEPVRLVILTYRGSGALREADIGAQAAAHLRALGHDPDGIADVELRLDPVPHGGMPGLYRSADAFVLATRGEGAGMPVFEAAACGVPVIATAFGGHEELMDPEIAFPVEVEALVPAAGDLVRDNPIYQGMLLAEPSVASLRAQMRAVADEPSVAARRAEGAREVVRERFSPAAVARIVGERAAELTGGRSPAAAGVGRRWAGDRPPERT